MRLVDDGGTQYGEEEGGGKRKEGGAKEEGGGTSEWKKRRGAVSLGSCLTLVRHPGGNNSSPLQYFTIIVQGANKSPSVVLKRSVQCTTSATSASCLCPNEAQVVSSNDACSVTSSRAEIQVSRCSSLLFTPLSLPAFFFSPSAFFPTSLLLALPRPLPYS